MKLSAAVRYFLRQHGNRVYRRLLARLIEYTRDAEAKSMTREQLRDFLVIELARLIDSGRTGEIKALLAATREFWLFLKDIPPILWTNIPASFRHRNVFFIPQFWQVRDENAGQLGSQFGGDEFLKDALEPHDRIPRFDEAPASLLVLGEIDRPAGAHERHVQFGDILLIHQSSIRMVSATTPSSQRRVFSGSASTAASISL
jgi:hypothetical protein